MIRLCHGFVLLSALLLAACNTVEGAGEDLTRAGVAVQQEARKAN